MLKKNTSLFLFLFIVITACSTDDITSDQTDRQVTLVETVPIKQSSLQQNLELNGQLMPQTQVPLLTALPLEITKVYVNIGQKVNQGDLLLTLNDEQAKRQVTLAKEAVTELEEGLNRALQYNKDIEKSYTDLKEREDELKQAIERSQTLLNSLNTEEHQTSLREVVQSSIEISLIQAELTQAAGVVGQAAPIHTYELEAQLKNAQESVRQAEAALKATKLTAPITGVIGQLDATPGQIALPNQPLIMIADLINMHATFALNHEQVTQLTPGMNAQINVPGITESMKGEIKTVSPLIDPQTGSFTMTIPLSNEDLTLKGGMRVTATVTVKEIEKATVVPTGALLFEDNEPYTFVVDGTQVRRQPLKLGIRSDDLHQVLSGLEIGDVVVTSGKQRLVDGSEITIRSE